MRENRNSWLDLLLSAEIEGGWSDRPLSEDPGGWTMRGISHRCYSDYLDRPATKEEMQAITDAMAREIAVAMFWNPVNSDKLPGGIDILAADFAFHSHWLRAGKELQQIVGVEVDGFVGDRTLTAVRKWKPAELMEQYVDAREAFLEELPNYDANAKGWKKRLRLMKALARTKLQASPGLAEAAGSKIIKTNAPVAVASTGGLVWAISEYGPQVVAWLRDYSSDPAALEHLQTGVQYVGTLPMAVTVLGGLLLLSTAGNAATMWWRWKMYKRGEV